MKTAVICFTSHGEQTACRIAQGMPDCQVWIKKRKLEMGSPAPSLTTPTPERNASCMKQDNSILADTRAEDISLEKTGSIIPEKPGVVLPAAIPLTVSLKEWTGQRFKDSDALIFVGATGIAVRSIAPFLQSKKTDPAVLVVDERGTFVISLISGHIGGANELALRVAEKIGALPVVTTATDRNGLWAVDVFARKNGLSISDMKLAKYVSAALLDRQKVYFGSEFPIAGNCPPELTQITAEKCDEFRKEKAALTVWVGIHTAEYLSQEKGRMPVQNHVLVLAVPVVTLGIGCRKGKEAEKLIQFVTDFLKQNFISPSAVEQICSIDIKKDEPGILAVAEKMKAPFVTFSAEELRNCPGQFTPSAFVAQTVGVDNVCERSALLGAIHMEEKAGKGSQPEEVKQASRLILHKNAQDGMTIAAAVRSWQGTF